MNRSWERAHYSTVLARDDAEGWTALELRRATDGVAVLVARIVYWDAAGQFYLDSVQTELPLDIVAELIAEARATIRLR